MSAAATPAAATTAAPAAADPFAALDKDALQPLSPESAKRHTAADIQIYASPEKAPAPSAAAAAAANGHWKCKLCAWSNEAKNQTCYLCKATMDGKKPDAKKPSAFAEKVDMNAASLASPTAASALDELMAAPTK